MNLPPSTYLGDAVYVAFDGYHIVLTTSNGLEETNRICLEPDVMDGLLAYVKRLATAIHAAQEASS